MEAPLSSTVRAEQAWGFARLLGIGQRREVRLAAVAASALLAACGPTGNGPSEMGPALTYKPEGRAIRWDATPSQRFGISASDFAGAKGNASAPEEGGLHWTMPAGWKELPAAQFRNPNFQVGPNPEAQCYLTVLAGAGGGLEGNVNRWRQQVSLPSLDAAAIAALPKVEWLGQAATYCDFTGEFTGMSGDQAPVSRRLVGLILIGQEESLFLKMLGPAQDLEGQIENFKALAQSFHGGEGHSHEGESAPAPVQVGTTGAKTAPPIDPSQGLPPDHPPMPGQQKQVTTKPTTGEMPAGHPPVGASGGAIAQGADPMRSEMLAWTPPAGWKRGEPKTMRETTYFADGAECWVTLLPGDGGGLLANLNRWCTQMGAQQLTDGDLAKLERVPMHGSEGVIVRLARGASATAAAGSDALLGAVCILDGRSLFVKMTGPAAAVDGQKAAFTEFCRSLRPVQ